MDNKIIKELNELIEKRENIALVTVIKKAGSGPRDIGSMMIIDENGKHLYGTIGGGGVEEQAKKDAKACIEKNESKMYHYELTLSKTQSSLGMVCGGVVDVFIKVFKNSDHLVIVGGGHIGIDLSKLAKSLGYYVTVIDHREEYANISRFPWVDKTLSGGIVEHLNEIHIDRRTSIVIITPGHLYDIEALRTVVNKSARYIGMIGSKNKIKYCFKKLLEEGLNQDYLDRIHAPIGIDIGGDTPAEIALSIISEIQSVKYGKSGLYLKDRREA